MNPYNQKSIIEIIDRYNNKISENQIGNYKIIKTKHNNIGYLYEKQEYGDLTIPELRIGNEMCMQIGPREIQGSYEVIKFAKGKVGIVGLGLGYVVEEMAKNPKVTEIIVYEKSRNIIKLYKENFGDNPKIKIINKDAYKAKRERFDFFFVDIYGYELSLKVVEDYVKFKKIHDIKEYSFWGMEHFLLSCSYEEIIWVFIPEMWMEMSKNAYSNLDESGYLQHYKKLDDKLVSDVLAAFKVVFDEEDDMK